MGDSDGKVMKTMKKQMTWVRKPTNKGIRLSRRRRPVKRANNKLANGWMEKWMNE